MENSPIHGPFSEDFRLVWVPGWQSNPVRLSEDQSKIFKVLWELGGGPVSGRQLVQQAGLRLSRSVSSFFKGHKIGAHRAFHTLVTLVHSSQHWMHCRFCRQGEKAQAVGHAPLLDSPKRRLYLMKCAEPPPQENDDWCAIVHGPFSRNFRCVHLPDWPHGRILLSEHQAALFKSLWHFQGVPVFSEELLKHAGLSQCTTPSNLFFVHPHLSKKTPLILGPKFAYKTLVIVARKNNHAFFSMPCASPEKIHTYRSGDDISERQATARAKLAELIIEKCHHEWTPDEIAVLKARFPNELTTVIAKELGLERWHIYNMARVLGLKRSDDFAKRLNEFRSQHALARFRHGYVPWSKGPRNADSPLAPNEMPIDSERMSWGYLYRKISIGQRKNWRLSHHLNWLADGREIPLGHVLTFKDGNKLNTSLENLELISRAELMRRNSWLRYGPEVSELIFLTSVITRRINKRRRS